MTQTVIQSKSGVGTTVRDGVLETGVSGLASQFPTEVLETVSLASQFPSLKKPRPLGSIGVQSSPATDRKILHR